MTDVWKKRADLLLEVMQVALPFSPEHETVKVQALALVNERVDAEGLRGKVWGAMMYVCDHGHQEWFAMEVGVEGPQSYRDDGTYIAAPFYAGRCATCNGQMKHENFRGDMKFEPQDPGALLPNEMLASNIFRLPREQVRWVTHLDEDGVPQYATGDGAYLQINMEAIRAKWSAKS